MLNLKEQRQQLKKNMFTHNTGNMAMLKKIDEHHHTYAKHMLVANSLVDILAKYNVCNIDFLDLPMCPSCERPAMWHENNTGYCEQHGSFKDPKTFREYLAQDICEFGFDTETLEGIEKAMFEFDKELQEQLLQELEVNINGPDTDN